MNELIHREEFRSILRDYKVSSHAQTILSKTKLLLLAGVTSSGRNTVLGELLKSGKYHYITSNTTRKPRLNHGRIEQNGEEYWFTSEEEFLDGLRKGEYVEAAIIHDQQVSGISIDEIEIASKEGKIAATDIEIVGVASIVDSKPDTVSVFMIPPNFQTWLERINGRGHMAELELRRRLNSAVKEINEALSRKYFVIVVNDEFHKTAKIIDNIFENTPDQEQPRVLAKKLLLDTQKFLNND
jgi:guanylate kinase